MYFTWLCKCILFGFYELKKQIELFDKRCLKHFELKNCKGDLFADVLTMLKNKVVEKKDVYTCCVAVLLCSIGFTSKALYVAHMLVSLDTKQIKWMTT